MPNSILTVCAVVAIAVLAMTAIAVYRHQHVLRDRAQMMRDAIRFRDYAFQLPTRGLLFGERALQEALNDMGKEIQKLEAHHEVESWQRLTRVLTHEIMNATTPIQSISQAYLNHPEIKDSPYEEGIRAIYDTSSGLATFVDSYRKLTQLQEPVPTDVNLADFLRKLEVLYPQVEWKTGVEPSVTIHIDENLLRQVFINLTKNAIEAGAKTIGIGYDGNISISNDGHVIPENARKEIFIPFFTTKQTGSGIGLSLSRQILMKQGYMLTLGERPAQGYNVTFRIERER